MSEHVIKKDTFVLKHLFIQQTAVQWKCVSLLTGGTAGRLWRPRPPSRTGGADLWPSVGATPTRTEERTARGAAGPGSTPPRRGEETSERTRRGNRSLAAEICTRVCTSLRFNTSKLKLKSFGSLLHVKLFLVNLSMKVGFRFW